MSTYSTAQTVTINLPSTDSVSAHLVYGDTIVIFPIAAARQSAKKIAEGEACQEDVSDLEADISDLNQVISQKDTIIGRHLNTMSRKDTVIFQQDNIIGIKDGIIADKDVIIKKKKRNNVIAWGVAILVAALAIFLRR
jgi:hypothetical protein